MKTEQINDYARPSQRLVDSIKRHYDAMLKHDKETAMLELEKMDSLMIELWKATIDAKT